jgi:nicotinamide riboside kinase
VIKRVALSGCGGSGKSTLATALSLDLGWSRVAEGVRDYLKKNKIDGLRKLSAEETMKMQWELLNKKIETEKSLEQFVADRSTADNVAYALRWCAWDVPEKEVRDYVKEAFAHAYNTYDLIIHLPWGAIPLEGDGIRSDKKMYQYEIDASIRGLLMKWEIPHYICKSITVKDRVDECLHIMNKKRLYTDIHGLVSSSGQITLTT